MHSPIGVSQHNRTGAERDEDEESGKKKDGKQVTKGLKRAKVDRVIL